MDVRLVSSSMATTSVVLLAVVIASAAALAQDGTPKFNKRLQVADGRTFVSDGAFAVDDAIAKVKDLSTFTAVPGTVLDKYFQAPFASESSGADLSSRGANYVTPDGTLLNARYIDFLRQHSALRRLKFRTSGLRQPVILVLDGRPVGVLMPMAQ